MAKTITQLPDATTVGAADEIIIQQSGVTKRATIDELKTQVAALGARDVTVSAANRSITNTGNFALSFGTNNTERMRIDASGSVGIGTASPARKFHTAVVAAPAAAQSSKVGLLIQNGDGTGTSGSPNSAIIQFAYDPASPRAYIEAGTLGNDFLAFGYETTERMRIDASGNVGIGGTANAAAILDAASTTKGFLPPRMTTAERDAISSPPAGLVLYNTSTNKLQVRTNTAWADLH
jgi:hypothetical protein